MIDLRSASDVRLVMRQLFGAAAGVAPHLISDAAMIYEPAPPADNLNLEPERVESLIVDSARPLLGAKLQEFFRPDLVAPGALTRQRFGPLADLQQAHFNSLAQSAAFIAVCDGLAKNPHEVTTTTPIQHIDEAGRRTFLFRVQDSVRTRICITGVFEFTQTRGHALMDAKKVEAAMDAVIGGLKDAIAQKGCI